MSDRTIRTDSMPALRSKLPARPTAKLAMTLIAALALAFVVLTSAVVPSAEARTRTYGKLRDLKVRSDTSMTGYAREKFPHWSDAQEYGWRLPSSTPSPTSCDARDGALIRDGKRVRVGSGCDISRGWFDPYTGNVYYQPSDIDVDHIVPLAEAWRTGASRWTSSKRERFANVPMDVLSVEDNANASKGDRSPEAWKPPRRAYHCTYAKKWIGVKYRWKLTATRSERRALRSMLGTCSR